ncbi:UNVERIFIED_CONTAM: hypothetical protein RMT77_003776 [Armadillidium vulgare]
MDSTSTPQALFSLIVMIIVIAFVLFYFCWGIFNCRKKKNESRAGYDREEQNQGMENRCPQIFVIPSYSNIIYISDGQTEQLYTISMPTDKPPSYNDVFPNVSPTPERIVNLGHLGSERSLPSYEESV